MDSPGRSERLELTVDAATAAASAARFELVEWLEVNDADEVAVEELAVVISELVSNAVRACRPGTNPSVSAWIEDEDVFLEVGNTLRPDAAAHTDWDLDDTLRHGGRGLLLVRAFVDDLEVEPDMSTEGVVFRCRRPLHSTEA